ncbi:exodeoxyribonuclease VII small subunit [Halanaerobium sp. MA284_MarDTE_T2]|nr:exodeoxyribonuclease VII small subunit [Halanaerobium sp. MA284_MarDTE_T2]RCW82183.1 exodeoxyribonuclease VII small subunit [Halanaerobium sp. DL-01]
MMTEETNDIKFEKALEELEKIVNELEKGGLSLEDSLDKFSRGMKLIKMCHTRLDKAEKEIELVLKENGEFSKTVNFEDDNEDEDK